MIAVDPDHQRRGIGDMLLSHAIAELHASGVDVVSIGTGADPGTLPPARYVRSTAFGPCRWPFTTFRCSPEKRRPSPRKRRTGERLDQPRRWPDSRAALWLRRYA